MRLLNKVAIVTGGSRRILPMPLYSWLSDEASYITGVVLSADGMARS